MKYLSVVAVLALAVLLSSQPAPRVQIGPQADGSVLLNNFWKLRPVGKQIPVDTLPMSTALSPDGKYLLVLNGGYRKPSISVIDVASETETSRVPVADGWLGLTFAANGKLVYVGGGSTASVFEFRFADGKLEPARTFVVAPPDKKTNDDFVGDVTLSPDGRLLYAAVVHRNQVAVINPQSGLVIEQFKTGRRPYRLLFHPDGQSLFVSSWADGAIYHHKAETGQQLGALRLGPHTTDMLFQPRRGDGEGKEARLFVTASNTNRVFVVSVSDSKDLQPSETINVALTPNMPAGMTPSALSLSKDGNRLYIVCSDATSVAVADVGEERSTLLGRIPAGWYPTAVRALDDGRVIILNGRGLRSFPNPEGPNPLKRVTEQHRNDPHYQHVGNLQTGTVSVVPPITEAQLAGYTRTVMENSPYRDALLENAGTPPDSPIPSQPGQPSPIKHVIYIVKENRTYDQMLGDMKSGNGDPSLVLFGENVSPNHHKLAKQFVLFDNFYVNADVSADGHNWSTSAIANDYVQKMWPNHYGTRRRVYDFEGGEVAAYPPAGYIWSNALSAGLTIRNFGWWTTNMALEKVVNNVHIAAVKDPALQNVTNREYRGFDLNYPDVDRARVFLKDLAGFEQSGTMPQLMFVRIGNDHTSGTSAGKIAPLSAVADNDQALGMIVEAVSKSRFWPQTAIFVLEDDAQNGADHVDSHRSPAFVISPYTQRGIVDSTMYNTTSMLRTIELILGLRPMTQFDAAARPMYMAFQKNANVAPYVAEKPRIPLDQKNPANAPAAAASARMNFDEADEVDDDELNAILWTAIRKSTPPAPVRSFFGH